MSEIKVQYPIGGFAPGMYGNTCRTCGTEFMGDKYARQCEPCAINTVNESNTKALKELHGLKTALQNIELSYETINNALKQANGANTENCKCAIPDVSHLLAFLVWYRKHEEYHTWSVDVAVEQYIKANCG